jgi:tRNA dimethylallyltransferase
MIEKGLLEEARLLQQHKTLNALQTVGYRELFNYFDGEFTKEFAISEIKKNTRRFAKRQLTWFKKDQETLWFDSNTAAEEIILKITQKMNAF